MRFTHRIMVLPLVTAVLFAVIFVIAFANLRETTRLMETLQSDLFAAVDLTHRLELDALRLRTELDAAISVRDAEAVAATERIANRFRSNLEIGRRLQSVSENDLASLGTDFERYDVLARRVALALIRVQGIPDDRLLDDAEAMNSAYDLLQRQVDALNSAQVLTMRSTLSSTQDRLRSRARFIILLAVTAVGVLLVLAWMAVVSMVRPLRELRLATAAIAKGELDTELNVGNVSDDDLGQLADSFREMQRALEADISHREEVEAALRESESRLALALDAANDGIWDLDLKADTFYASDRFAAILGYRPDEKPRNYAQLMDMMGSAGIPQDAGSFAHEPQQEREVSFEERMRRKDGSWAWVLIKGRTVLFDDDGEPVRMVGTISDISARKAAEEELHRAQDRLVQSEKLAGLGRLVAGIVHEFNSPMGALVSGSDLTRRGVEILRSHDLEDDPRAQRALRSLERSAEGTAEAAGRVQELLEGLKRFTALDRADLQEADIHELLDTTLTVMGAARWEGIETVRHFGELPRVLCYPGQLNQLFVALLRNAAEAMPDGGQLTLRTLDRGRGQVVVEVEDTGRGIPEAELDSLFEPRFRDGSGRVHLGWGLVTAARIAAEHGGEISVDSAVGRGSTFRVTLPLRPEGI